MAYTSPNSLREYVVESTNFFPPSFYDEMCGEMKRRTTSKKLYTKNKDPTNDQQESNYIMELLRL